MNFGAWQLGSSRRRPNYLIILLILLHFLLIYSICSQGEDCIDCELTHAILTNIAVANSTDALKHPAEMKIAYAKVNATFCGCPDLTNLVLVNSTDQSGRNVGPRTALESVNLTYWPGLDVTKRPLLVTDLDRVGLDLALVEYNITVINTGEVNVTGIKLHDILLGDYSVVNLTPGQEVILYPYPEYIITQDDAKYCWIHNTAMVTGKDRCCEPIGPYYAYADFPLGAKRLEDYLKIYSVELQELGYDIKKAPNPERLDDFEKKIRIQANRLMTFEDTLHGNLTCEIPDPPYLPTPHQEQTCCTDCEKQR